MGRRNRIARTVTALGVAVLFATACVHGLAYATTFSPAVAASNLRTSLEAICRIAFLAMAWHWIVLGIIVLLAAFAETQLGKPLVLICGVAMLAETGLTLGFIAPFIGNELIGTAGLLIVCGGLLLERAGRARAGRDKVERGSDADSKPAPAHQL